MAFDGQVEFTGISAAPLSNRNQGHKPDQYPGNKFERLQSVYSLTAPRHQGNRTCLALNLVISLHKALVIRVKRMNHRGPRHVGQGRRQRVRRGKK